MTREHLIEHCQNIIALVLTMTVRFLLSLLLYTAMDPCKAFSNELSVSPPQKVAPLRASLSESTSFTNTKCSRAAQEAQETCVIGGGLAGLATAAALVNIAGIQSVKVLEKASQEEWERPTAGAAVQLGPNGLRALECIGGNELVSDIMQQGTCLVGNAVILPQTEDGEQNVMMIPDSTRDDTGLSQVLIRWGVLRSLLVKLLPSKCITTGVGSNVAGYSVEKIEGKECVTAVTADKTALTTSETSRLLVAADGIYSTFQSLIHSGDKLLPSDMKQARRQNIKDGGRINIKAVAPTDLDPEQFQAGTTYSFFSPGGAAACFAGPAGKGYTYWAVSIADETSADGEIQRFLSDLSTDRDSVKQQLLSRLASLESPECQFVIDLIEQTNATAIFVARSEEREHVGPSLVSDDGKVVLVGDAAHAMSPAYGQAANFAFEDAATLATCIREGDDLQSALKDYSEARVARCIEMQRRSAERTAKATRGETTEDVSKWIFQWTI